MTMTDPMDEIAAQVASQREELDGDGPRDPDVAPPEEESSSTALDVLAENAELPVVPEMSEIMRLATLARMYSESRLVPEDLRRKPHDILLVLMTGRDLGIAPTSALRKCYVVDGQVTIAPALKIAMVKNKGLGQVRPPGRYLRGVTDEQGRPVEDPDYPNTATRATALICDLAGHEISRYSLERSEVDLVKTDSARTKSLTEKANWRNYPARMLWWRCAGYAVDDYFPEVAFGLYTPDEIGAVTDADGELLDLDSVELPAGFGPRPVQLIAEHEAETLRSRANALPPAALRMFKQRLGEREIGLDGFPFSLPAGKLAIVTSLLAALEKEAEQGKYTDEGSYAPPSDQTVDAEVECENCHEAPCVCDAGPDSDAQDAATGDTAPDIRSSTDDPAGAPPGDLAPDPRDLVGLSREELMALGKARLVAACEVVGAAHGSKASLEELADAYLKAEPF
jgi:hypothetical protein